MFYGLPLQQGDRILTSVHEYAANYIAFLQVCDPGVMTAACVSSKSLRSSLKEHGLRTVPRVHSCLP